MKKYIYKNAFLNALGTVLYISLVSSFLSNAEHIFGNVVNEKSSILVPVMMLTLFVVSAAITGFLVFGRPIMWYIDGKKKEALRLAFSTVAFLILAFLVFMLLLIAK